MRIADPVAEYRAAREEAGFIERASDGRLELTGADRVKFLHGLVSNDIQKLSPGRACLAALLDNKGHVHSLLAVAAREDRLLLRLPPGAGPRIAAILGRFVISEDVSIRDVSAERSVVTVLGPKAEAAVHGLEAYRTDEYGSPTFDVWLPAGGRLPQGRAAALGPAAFESIRIEAGVPAMGADVDPSVLLPETGQERLVSYDKGCYLGQETVARVKYRGRVNRKLAGLVFQSDAPPAAGAVVAREGRELGKVTSAAWSFAFDRPIALAYLRADSLEPGLEVEAGGSRAQVSALPFSLPAR